MCDVCSSDDEVIVIEDSPPPVKKAVSGKSRLKYGPSSGECCTCCTLCLCVMCYVTCVVVNVVVYLLPKVDSEQGLLSVLLLLSTNPVFWHPNRGKNACFKCCCGNEITGVCFQAPRCHTRTLTDGNTPCYANKLVFQWVIDKSLQNKQ